MNDREAWSLPPNPATLCLERMSGRVYLLFRQYLSAASSHPGSPSPPPPPTPVQWDWVMKGSYPCLFFSIGCLQYDRHKGA